MNLFYDRVFFLITIIRFSHSDREFGYFIESPLIEVTHCALFYVEKFQEILIYVYLINHLGIFQ